MAAVINASNHEGASSSSVFGDGKPALLYKIEGHIARINDVVLLAKDEGVWTCSEDRTVRLYLKRDNEQFWPSIIHYLPLAPTCIYYSEETYSLLVGLINGNVYEFSVADDFNSMTEKRKWTVHAGPVSGLGYGLTSEQIFSCSKDKTVVWHCSETGVKLGQYNCENSCTALVIDLPFAFIGDYGGHIVMLRLSGNNASVVTKLSAHTGAISSLAFDRLKEVLYSGSYDNLVIMWDIGGGKGEAYELNGHSTKVTSLVSASGARRLFSADDSGNLTCWDMKTKRLETPGWKTSDCCQQCNSPFFWNLTAMWQRKVVGLRQHHCRTCGAALCGSCCNNWTTYPPMGYELKIRICKACNTKMQEHPENFDLTPLAVRHEVKSGITSMYLQETQGRLVTSTQSRTILVWDVKSLL